MGVPKGRAVDDGSYVENIKLYWSVLRRFGLLGTRQLTRIPARFGPSLTFYVMPHVKARIHGRIMGSMSLV